MSIMSILIVLWVVLGILSAIVMTLDFYLLGIDTLLGEFVQLVFISLLVGPLAFITAVVEFSHYPKMPDIANMVIVRGRVKKVKKVKK